MFQERKAPEGYEFGACALCNSETSDSDLMVSALARMGLHSNGNSDGRAMGLMRMANRQFPGMLRRMMPSATEARRMNRDLSLTPPPGMLHEHSGVAKVTNEHMESLRTFAAKMTKAAYFKHVEKVFPAEGAIAFKLFTSADALSGDFKFVSVLEGLAGEVPAQRRTKVNLSDQFSYKVSMSAAQEVMILQLTAYKSFGIVTFSSADPGIVRGAVSNLEGTAERSGVFELIQ